MNQEEIVLKIGDRIRQIYKNRIGKTQGLRKEQLIRMIWKSYDNAGYFERHYFVTKLASVLAYLRIHTNYFIISEGQGMESLLYIPTSMEELQPYITNAKNRIMRANKGVERAIKQIETKAYLQLEYKQEK